MNLKYHAVAKLRDESEFLKIMKIFIYSIYVKGRIERKRRRYCSMC